MIMGWGLFEIVLGCFLAALGITGKEFYPGRAGRERGLPPLDPWIGRLIFLGFGLAAILNGIHNLRRH